MPRISTKVISDLVNIFSVRNYALNMIMIIISGSFSLLT